MKTWIVFALALPCVAATVEFNRDIRPIFSDKCYTCHGPDKANLKSKLRLDTEAGARIDLGGHFALVPGDLPKSELIQRVTSHDLGRRMPPQYAGASRLTSSLSPLVSSLYPALSSEKQPRSSARCAQRFCNLSLSS